MRIRNVRALHGPNLWARDSVLEAEVDLEELDSFHPAESADFFDRLTRQWQLAGRPSPEGLGHLSLPEIIGRLALNFQTASGSPVRFSAAERRPGEDFTRVAVEFEEEKLGRAALAAARAFCLAAVAHEPFDLPSQLLDLRNLAHEVRLGPSTGSVVNAAKRRKIPVRRLNDGSLVQLGQGIHQRRIWTAETDQTGSIGETIAQDKQLTRALLANVGVPVPAGRHVIDADDAWCAAQELGMPVVLKPQYGNQGRAVAVNLCTREQVMHAHQVALATTKFIVVERFIPGFDYRLLVVGNRVVAASRREPAQVTGDGRSRLPNWSMPPTPTPAVAMAMQPR